VSSGRASADGLFRGLFDGEHYFILAPGNAGSTILTQGEDFAGLLVPLLRSALEGKTRAGFEAMNLALKQRLADLYGAALAR
jgi:hypothetical protein